ncbi:MAG TPA: signal peptidase II [Clostridiales bacterium]|nr:signal peptidase II [Clostridiales bacterium]
MLYAIVTVLILIFDQGLKYWTTLNIPYGDGVRNLIPGFIRLAHIQNYGAAFGILQNTRWLLVAVTVLFAIAVIVLVSTKTIKGAFGRWMAIMVLAGALGNGIDRVLHGYVVDMLEFEFINFEVFNVADIFITVGGILFCLYVIFRKDAIEFKKREKPQSMSYVKQRQGADIRKVQKPRLTKETASDPVLAAAAAAAEAAKARAAREAAQEADILKQLKKEQKLPEPEDSELEFTLEDILAEFSDK